MNVLAAHSIRPSVHGAPHLASAQSSVAPLHKMDTGVGSSVRASPKPAARIVLTNDIDMNIPFAGLAAVLVLLFVKLPTPPGSIRSKLEKIDWM